MHIDSNRRCYFVQRLWIVDVFDSIKYQVHVVLLNPSFLQGLGPLILNISAAALDVFHLRNFVVNPGPLLIFIIHIGTVEHSSIFSRQVLGGFPSFPQRSCKLVLLSLLLLFEALAELFKKTFHPTLSSGLQSQTDIEPSFSQIGYCEFGYDP